MTNVKASIINDSAFKASCIMSQTKGMLVGISSGTSVFGALELARRFENTGKKIIVILSDAGDSCFSSGNYPYEDVKSKDPHLFFSF
jgi:cysteine synthase A